MSHVSMPIEAYRTSANLRRHIDGPLLSWAGRLHWLTIRERFALWLGLTSVEALAQRQWPDYKSRLAA